MGKIDLQCLLIGEKPKLYASLLDSLKELDLNLQVKQVNTDKNKLKLALKKIRGAGLVFISDEVPFSLVELSDLIWQYSSDVIVVILTEKTASTSFKKPFNNTHFTRLHFKKGSKETRLFLDHQIQTVQLKQDFRRCKRLLGVSEKRCQWLVDSSKEAVAYISRDMHLYANKVYLKLFNIESIQDLHSTPVKEFLVENEVDLFKSFINNQLKKHKLSRTLVLSMRKRNGEVFRASIVAIPSVFKGKKCIQLWIHPLKKHQNKNEESDKTTAELMNEIMSPNNVVQQEKNPFDVLKTKKKQKNKRAVTPAMVLKGIVKRKEISISAKKLVAMKKNEGNYDLDKGHHMLSLKVPVVQKKGIDDLLFDSATTESQTKQAIFWDKVKLTRLLQIIIQKKARNINLLVRISDVSASHKEFAEWLLPGLKTLGVRTSNITILFPSQLNEKQRKQAASFIKKLRLHNCKIALDDFSASKQSLSMLKHVSPDYVRLSLPWVKMIEGNNSREIALGSLIRQLEARQIRVIAPCGFSLDMRKLFSLSGASFCQESATKSG